MRVGLAICVNAEPLIDWDMVTVPEVDGVIVPDNVTCWPVLAFEDEDCRVSAGVAGPELTVTAEDWAGLSWLLPANEAWNS